ncbi:MAG: hypothetical protein R3A44_06215 [Caldilineaceae bacterium]
MKSNGFQMDVEEFSIQELPDALQSHHSSVTMQIESTNQISSRRYLFLGDGGSGAPNVN